jgi:hypothetical protein
MLTFRNLIDFMIVDPSPAMTGDFVAAFYERQGGTRVPFQCHRNSESCEFEAPIIEQLEQSPKPHPAPILIQGFNCQAAGIFEGRRWGIESLPSHVGSGATA